jgi:hypothetical protein
MSGVRVLVGTRKGAFVMTSDGGRRDWDIAGPHFGGWEIYHVTGSPAAADRLYASQSGGWFGQVIQRSDDGGRTWELPLSYLASPPSELSLSRGATFRAVFTIRWTRPRQTGISSTCLPAAWARSRRSLGSEVKMSSPSWARRTTAASTTSVLPALPRSTPARRPRLSSMG